MIILGQVEIVLILYAINLMVRKKWNYPKLRARFLAMPASYYKRFNFQAFVSVEISIIECNIESTIIKKWLNNKNR